MSLTAESNLIARPREAVTALATDEGIGYRLAFFYVNFYVIAVFGAWNHLVPPKVAGFGSFSLPLAPALFIVLMRDKGLKTLIKPMIPLIGFLIGYMMITIAVSRHLDDLSEPAVERALDIFMSLVSCAVVFRNRSSLPMLAFWLQMTSIATMLICLRQNIDPRFWASQSTTYEDFRPSGLYDNPNVTGLFLLTSIMLSGFCRSSAVKWIGRGAALVGIWFSASRGAIAMLAVVAIVDALYYLVGRFGKGAPLVKFTVAVAVLAMFGGGYFYIATSLEGVSQTRAAESDQRLNHILSVQNGADTRENLLQEWFRIAEEAPVLGYGMDADSSYSREFGEEMGPHNLFLHVWLEAGLGALLVFVVVLVAVIAPQRKLPLSGGEKAMCWLLWVVWIIYMFKGHNALDNSEFMEIWSIAILLPYALARTTDPIEGTNGGPTSLARI